MKANKCEICKKRNEIRRTFRICSSCLIDVSPAHQKALVDNYQQGQAEGYVQPNEKFLTAIHGAIGDIYFKKYGARIPDKAIRDRDGIVIGFNDLVNWQKEDGSTQWGKVVATYWELKEITIRYYENDYPKSIRLHAQLTWLRKKFNEQQTT